MLEEAVDGGGPSREFACLVAKEISSNLFEGTSKKVLLHDSLGLQVCKVTVCLAIALFHICLKFIPSGKQVLFGRAVNGHDNSELWWWVSILCTIHIFLLMRCSSW